MLSLFSEPNPHAPVYEPEKWNAGAGVEQLQATLQDFFRKASFTDSIPVSLSNYLQVFDMIRRDKEGIDRILPHQEDSITAATNIPFSALKALHNAVSPYLGLRLYKNCYAYATDNDSLTESYMASCMPGARGSKTLIMTRMKGVSFADCRVRLIDNCEADGHEYIGLEPKRDHGRYLIGLFLGENPATGAKDFHFVREDHDGHFSHKSGMNVVSRHDQRGRPLMDPADAVFTIGPYKYGFEGYFLTPKRPEGA